MSELHVPQGIKIKQNEPLCAHCTMRIGGAASYAAFPHTAAELSLLLKEAAAQGVRCFVAGNGSNLLFDDAGFDGLVIFTTEMRAVTWRENTVRAECGASFTALAREAARRGLSGLEFACGIPGTVGGAVYMNAGAYGAETADILVTSTYLSDGEIRNRENGEHAFSYRSSVYQTNREVIIDAEFALVPDDPAAVQARSEQNVRARRNKQPLEYPNAGSIFKRPKGTFAGALIEGAGLKGLRIGGAAVSEKHAGFIINRGGATAEDVRRLIDAIQAAVFQQYGISLETEIIFIR